MINYIKISNWLERLLIRLEANLSLFFMRQAYWVVDLNNIAHGPILSAKKAHKMAATIGYGRLIATNLRRGEWIILLSGHHRPRKLIKKRYNINSGSLY